MSWRDRLAPASFRGVAFSVDRHDAQVGRRVAVHEFPQRELPYVEDLGRSAEAFRVEAFVLGEDYDVRRDQLMAAARALGAGQLVHPYLGEMRVQLLRAQLRESTAEGGIARIVLEFVEAGEARLPTNASDTGSGVVAAQKAASTAVQASFAQRHALARRPQFVADASKSIFDSALTTVTQAAGKVRGAANQVAALQRQVNAARSNITTLLFAPASAAQALASNVERLVRSVASTPRDAMALARVFYRFGFDLAPVAGTTLSRQAQARNQAELVQLARTLGVAEGARAAVGVAWESYQEATAARDEIVDTLDDLMLTASTDDLYGALRTLRAALVRDVASRGQDLARLVSWTPAATRPALACVQALYADGTRADELVQRNRIRHPLFVAGGRALEVLADG